MAAPRAVKDSDTALWLHNKLGSAEELWVSSSIGGIIKTDTIDNIYRCFPVLTSTVKMKLLLGILHLPRRNLDEMKHTIEGLVELALEDTDQWVRLVADVVKTYPMRGKLNLTLSSSSTAKAVIDHLKEKVNDSNVFATLPLECQYVNKNALQSLVGNQPPPVRHFALKRKPKSAALRVDLMQRSNDASSQVKKEKTVPVKHRDMTRKLSDASPMRGIPKAPASGHRTEGFRTQATPSTHLTPGGGSRTTSRFSSRAERGTKLLDISEQPLGIREQKRRKKQQQEEDVSQPLSLPEEKTDETPEYAAGLPQTIVTTNSVEDVSVTENDSKSDTQKSKNDSDDDDDNEADIEDEEYQEHRYSPDSPPRNNFSTIDQDEQPISKDQPSQETVVTKRTSASESHVSMEELPVYAMPATPSPYFRPMTSNATVTVSTPWQSNISSNTSSPHTYSANASLSSSTPPREPVSVGPPAPAISSVIASASNVNSLLQVQKQHSSTSTLQSASSISYPQTPAFYTPMLNQQGAISQISDLQKLQKPMQEQPASIQSRTNATFGQSIQIRPAAVSYMVQPNIVQLKQLTGQTSGYPPTPGRTVIANRQLPLTATSNTVLQHQIQLQQAQMQQHAAQQLRAQQAQMQKKTLTLTPEQKAQAQEMFKTANRLSRQEKSIILGFIAGSRENPAPEKGDIAQITLSEHEQMMQNPGGSGPIPVIVETFFEMNYLTGASAKKQRIKHYVPQYNPGSG